MSLTSLPPSPMPELRTLEITEAQVPALQRFFEANPDYSLAVTGQPPLPDDAREALFEEPPPGWTFTRKWLIGYVDEAGRIVAMADVVSDLLAPTVWHIGLFMVATARHGDGTSQRIFAGLTAWAAANGASWLRLGVVEGNVRAERFWRSQGFMEVRTRRGVTMGLRTNTIRVLVKPLGTGKLDDYLGLVERDRPDPQPGV